MLISRRIALLSSCVLIVTFLLAPAAGLAQDGDPLPGPLIPYRVSTAIRLPFTQTFDSRAEWEPRGAWHYEAENGYSGGAWFVAIAGRETLSTLEYRTEIDLTGKLNAQLMFRQQGVLPASDLVAVDISLDGGVTWIAIDMQVLVDADWDLQTVDLSRYRGQVVRLRFRVHAGINPRITGDDPVFTDYGIDNVVIQFFEEATEFVMPTVPFVQQTLMGLHLVVGAQKEPVVVLAERLRDIGWPLGTLKGTSGTEDILNAVERVSPGTTTVFRSLETPWGLIDCPNEASDPVAEARHWMGALRPYWAGVQSDYYEVVNECEPPVDWAVAFALEAMRIANTQGQCLLLFSFAPGHPEPEYFEQLLPVYQYALDNPCQPGRYHGIALHAYAVD